MKKVLIGMLILGAAIGAIAVILRRRSSSEDAWGSGAQDPYRRVSEGASRVASVGKETVSKATDAVKMTASKATSAAKDA
jgi:hypothetical protein